MRTKIFSLVLFCLSWSASGILGDQPRKQNLLFTQFESLIQRHDSFLRSQDKLFDKIARGFFSDFSFVNSRKTKNFFVGLHQSNQGRFYGRMMVSHMQMKIINGKQYAVHYTYQSDGKNVKMTKYTNNNGKVLKASYTYDMQKRSLEAKEYDMNKLLNQKLYKI